MERIKHDGSIKTPSAIDGAKAIWVYWPDVGGWVLYEDCEYGFDSIDWDGVLEYCIIPHPDDIPKPNNDRLYNLSEKIFFQLLARDSHQDIFKPEEAVKIAKRFLEEVG